MKTQSIQISLFYCANSLREDELGSICNQVRDIEINSISLPCSGKVNLLYLLKAIETGADGVLVVSCRLGDCRYLQGNYRAQKRVHFIDDLLHETGFEKGHVLFVDPQAEDKIDTIVSVIEQMVNSFRIEIQQVQK